jgi:outer membrane protein TolC
LAGLPLVGFGCSQHPIGLVLSESPPPVVRAADAEPLPPPTAAPAALPVGLDTVLRLAEEQNTQIALARERLSEAYAEKNLAALSWLPNVYLGPTWWRHEGGIQDPQGFLITTSSNAMHAGAGMLGQLDLRDAAYQRVHAARKVWQQKAEVSRITNETLLEASTTYIDLLMARHAEAVLRDLEQHYQKLLVKARELVKQQKGTLESQLLVEAIQSAISGYQQAAVNLRKQGNAASAKLAQLLGLDPATELQPMDGKLVAIDLVDAAVPTADLVARALRAAPGIREMEGMLGLITQALAESRGPMKMMPVLEIGMTEGAFAAATGAALDWSNRWDLRLQARWDLKELVTARDRRHLAESKMQQAQLAYQDLRGKLALGVQEAHESILSGREQIRLGVDQIGHAIKAYELSSKRLEELGVAGGASFQEVLQTLRPLETAHINYLQAVSAYDKAQLRLLLLLGSERECRE